MEDIIAKLKISGLVGRGGACYPTWLKWHAVKDFSATAKKRCFIVCNASEGEPGVLKDKYLLEMHADKVISGIRIALKFLLAEKAFIYLNPEYYDLFAHKLVRMVGVSPITVFEKSAQAGYVGGEETSALNHIEGKRIEPRLRPPFPVLAGLFGRPTLVNNVETFYAVHLIENGIYDYKRYYTVGGDCLNGGVYAYHESWTIEKILKDSENFPDYEFFVQAGGDASGEVLYKDQLDQSVGGSGAITVYSAIKHQPLDLMRRWANFFRVQSCGKCTPCREGSFRLAEILGRESTDWKLLVEILENLADTSFCGLGCAAPVAITSFIKNVLPRLPGTHINLPEKDRKNICACFN